VNKKDEALKMAIKEIEGWIDHAYGHPPEECADNKTIMACKEALEQPTVAELNDEYLRDTYVEGLNQPAQEPVAWMHRHAGEITEFNDFQSCQYCEPLYTHSHQWQGLTDDEIARIDAKMIKTLRGENLTVDDWIKEFAHAIEQALKDKNTCSL
jgi:hypothetical protein